MEAERLAAVLHLEESPAQETSIGLRNIDSRLRALYGESYRLAVTSSCDQGTCVQVRIPLEVDRLAQED